MKKHMCCYLCKSKKTYPLKKYYFTKGLIKCSNCGFVFMEKIPTEDELLKYYAQYSYGKERYKSPITVKSYNNLLDEFENYRKTNRILDVGCGRGWFLIEAQKRGWEVYGTEYSETGVSLCTEQGISMKQGKISEMNFETQQFDVVTSFEVIEHINNPNEHISKIASLIRKGGLFYCTTPNFNSIMRYYLKNKYNVITYPEHLSYFTKSTLNLLGNKHNLRPVKFLSTGISFARIRTSLVSSNKTSTIQTNSDESLRVQINNRWYLGLIKRLINKTLSFTNLGMTLKGYYVKN